MRGGTAGRLTGASPSGECGFHVCLRVRVQCTYACLNMSICIVHAPMRTFGDEGIKRAETAQGDREREERERDGRGDRDSQPARACESFHTYRSDQEWAEEDGWDQEIGEETVEAGNDIEKANAVSVCTQTYVCVCIYAVHPCAHAYVDADKHEYVHSYVFVYLMVIHRDFLLGTHSQKEMWMHSVQPYIHARTDTYALTCID